MDKNPSSFRLNLKNLGTVAFTNGRQAVRIGHNGIAGVILTPPEIGEGEAQYSIQMPRVVKPVFT
jgi:hypothetical protein